MYHLKINLIGFDESILQQVRREILNHGAAIHEEFPDFRSAIAGDRPDRRNGETIFVYHPYPSGR